MAYFQYKGKNVFYDEYGESENIVLLLHGNTSSSLMFSDMIKLFEKDFKIVVIDFLGCGKSEKVEKLDTDLWYDEAQQVIQLLDLKKYKNVNIIGTSGGAIVAINVALERPDLVNKVIADSFEGERALDIVTNTIVEDRENSKKDDNTRMFYYLMNGEDWEKAIDSDTKAMYEHAKKIKKFYHKDLNELSVPILFTGSKEDEFVSMISNNFYNELFKNLISKVQNGSMYIFEQGGHPAMLSNADKFFELAKEFLNSDCQKRK